MVYNAQLENIGYILLCSMHCGKLCREYYLSQCIHWHWFWTSVVSRFRCSWLQHCPIASFVRATVQNLEQQILTSKKLEPTNVWHICERNDWLADWLLLNWLIAAAVVTISHSCHLLLCPRDSNQHNIPDLSVLWHRWKLSGWKFK